MSWNKAASDNDISSGNEEEIVRQSDFEGDYSSTSKSESEEEEEEKDIQLGKRKSDKISGDNDSDNSSAAVEVSMVDGKRAFDHDSSSSDNGDGVEDKFLLPIFKQPAQDSTEDFSIDLGPSVPRYWQPEDSSIMCFWCGGIGHYKRDCVNQRRPKPCYLCGDSSHTYYRCPDTLCFKCHKPGHQQRECRNKKARLNDCYRCGDSGHLGTNCHNTVLFEAGGLPRPFNRKIGCCNCAADDHTATDCEEEVMNEKVMQMSNQAFARTSLPNTPKPSRADRRRQQQSYRQNRIRAKRGRVAPNN